MFTKRPPYLLRGKFPWAMAQRGLTIIELMIGIAIVSMLLLFAVPGMTTWLQGSQIRNATESIQGAMQLARAEAVRRNTNVELVLTSVAGGGNATDWVVRCFTSSATCPGAGQTETSIQERSGREGSLNATLTLNPPISTIVFSGTGRITPVPAGNIVIDVKHTTDTIATPTCLDTSGGGTYRCLRLVVAPGGQTRMCDPSLVAPNPRAC
ncbi:MAG: GspH/FimT family pseudopilin [Hylemonella sp.]|nr:GspH/FimT family pseudopilin [Hylemonella sp.]